MHRSLSSLLLTLALLIVGDVAAARLTVSAGDPAVQSKAFSAGPGLGERRASHTATLLADGRVLIVGGLDGGRTLASALLVDPVSGSVRATGSLQSARARHTATLLKNGRVLVAGGQAASGTMMTPLESVEIFDPASERFVNSSAMTAARASHAAVLLPDGKVLICGGLGATAANGVIAVHATAEVFDPATGRFAPAGNMTATRTAHTATLLETGQVLVTSNGTADLFDPPTNRFTKTGNPIAMRSDHTATLLGNGQVLIAGGIARAESLATAELYDPRAATFRATGNLVTSRTGHTATLLTGGKVLVAGGMTVVPASAAGGRTPYTATPVSSAEVYDAAAGTFAVTGSLITARTAHAAVSTPNGLWIVGGFGGMGLNSSEVFSAVTQLDPSTATAAAAPARVDRPSAVETLRNDRRYTSKTFGWSMAYPSAWRLDDRDPAYVRFQSPGDPAAFVGVHIAFFERERVAIDDFAEAVMSAESRRAGFRILSRRSTTLADGTPALEVVNVLGVEPAGRSRKIFAIVANRGFAVNAETFSDAWPSFEADFDRLLASFTVAPPTWQSRLEDAKRLASDGAEYTVTTGSGLHVFYNNSQPLCYAYTIPGDWVAAPEPSAYRSPDGKAFVGVRFLRREDLQTYSGRTSAERALNGITRRYEEGLGQQLTVQAVPFESSRPGTWKWTAAPIQQRGREITLTTKFVVPVDRDAVAEITITATGDDDALARRIIEALRTTTDRQCYWRALEKLLKGGA